MLDPTKKYKLRDSDLVRLVNPIQIAPPDKWGNYEVYPITAVIEYVHGEEPSFWGKWAGDGTNAGTKYSSQPYLDLVEDKPEWSDWPIDAKVLVRSKGSQEYTGAHYAGEVSGKPTVWIHGVTSWTVKYLVGSQPVRQFAFEIKLAEEQPE